MEKSTIPPAKIKPESTPIAISWNTILQIKNLNSLKISMTNLNAKSVLKKLKNLITSSSTHASAPVHVELYTWNVWLNGFTSRLRSKSSVEPSTTTSKNSSVKCARQSYQWSWTSMVPIKNCFQLKNRAETTLFYKEHVISKKVLLWSKTSPTKESSLAVDTNVKSASLTFQCHEITRW